MKSTQYKEVVKKQEKQQAVKLESIKRNVLQSSSNKITDINASINQQL
jgi:hypothetical protein